MVLPLARAQLVRYLTDRVLENVMQRLAQRTPALVAGEDAPAGLETLLPALQALQADLQATQARLQTLEARLARLERRYGWRFFVRILAALLVAFLLGFLLALSLKMIGWL